MTSRYCAPKKPPRCPRHVAPGQKCGAPASRYIELWKGHGIDFLVDAQCTAGHRWKIRGVTQIDQVRNALKPPAPGTLAAALVAGKCCQTCGAKTGPCKTLTSGRALRTRHRGRPAETV